MCNVRQTVDTTRQNDGKQVSLLCLDVDLVRQYDRPIHDSYDNDGSAVDYGFSS